MRNIFNYFVKRNTKLENRYLDKDINDFSDFDKKINKNNAIICIKIKVCINNKFQLATRTISGKPKKIKKDFDELKQDPKKFLKQKYFFDEKIEKIISLRSAVLYTVDCIEKF